MKRHVNFLTGHMFYVYGEPDGRVYEVGQQLSQYLGCEHIDLAFMTHWPVEEKLMYIKQQIGNGCVISGKLRGWGDELVKHVDYGFEVCSRANLDDRPYRDWLPGFRSCWLFTEDSIQRNTEVMKEMLSTILD
ncbi:MAG: hypothetical protein IJE07_06550 [Clostridia bacterium]|nr:hypothetical protein [Clostridia bacterium]